MPGPLVAQPACTHRPLFSSDPLKSELFANNRGAFSSVKMVGLASRLAFMLMFSTSVWAAELPSYIKVCNRMDPNLSMCVQKTVEEIRPYLVNGISEMNVPALEPLVMNEIVASESGSLRLVAKDVKAFGASDFSITNTKVTTNPLRVSFDLLFPLLYINADYEVLGRILLIPIKGNGALKANITNCKANVDLQGETIQKDGVDYANFYKVGIKYKIGSGSMQLDNIFGSEKLLGDVINNAINANFQVFAQELQPSIEKALERIMTEIAQRISESFTYDQILPP